MPNLVGDPDAPFSAELDDINLDGTTSASPSELNTRYQRILDSLARLKRDIDSAQDLLTKLKDVDGVGSGLDADLLDGQQGAYYRNAGNLNDGTLLSARFNDGSHGGRGGGGLHALATQAQHGFMSVNDKVKLDGIVYFFVDLNGDASGAPPPPAGWVITRQATGHFRVDPTVMVSLYNCLVMVTPVASSAGTPKTVQIMIDSNVIDIFFRNSDTLTPANPTGFMFLFMKQ